jgi:hypothetical protein
MSEARYRPLHPEIFRYDPVFLHPALLRGDPAEVLREDAEQIFNLRVFTESYCRLLVEEAEHCGLWRTAADVETNPYAEEIEELDEPDTTLHLHHMEGLDGVYREIVERHLRPLMERTWRTFRLRKVSPPYVLKYTPDAISGMALHHDLETVTLVVYLNDRFEGGGTRFPKWNYVVSGRRPGEAILYPGGLSHEHEGLPIRSGSRYLLLGSFY